MKARKVEGLDPDASFAENARLMAEVRIGELEALADKARDPSKVKAAHDARIAAKRVRYLLEITEPCFGERARAGAKSARKLQDVLGAIHDCDVMSDRIRSRAEAVPVEDDRYIGLEALASYLEARRRVLHRQFVDTWAGLDFGGIA